MEIKSWHELNKRNRRRRSKKKKRQLPSGVMKISENIVEQNIINNDLGFTASRLPSVEKNGINREGELSEDIQSEVVRKVSADRQLLSKTDKKNMKKTKKSLSKNYTRSSSKKKKSSGYGRWWLIGFLLLASLTVALGALHFATNNSDTQDLLLEIRGPEQVAVGEEAEWQIVYRNVGKIKLKKLEVTVNYPSGFKLIESNPAASNSYANIWDLGEISPGEEKQIKIRGQVFGEENKEKNFSVSLVYQPANFSSDFVKEATKKLVVSNSLIKIDIEQSDSILPVTDYLWKISVTNVTNKNINDWRVDFIAPSGFKMSEPSPESVTITSEGGQKKYSWESKSLWAKKTKTFMFKGNFPPIVSGVQELKAVVSRREGEIYKIIQEKVWNAVILSEELSLDLTVNGQDDLPEVSPGENLNYVLRLKNTSGKDLQDLSVGLKLSPEYIDWSNLKAPAAPQLTDDGWIKLTAKELESLASLSAGDELELSFSVRVKSAAGNTAKLKAYATVGIARVGDQDKEDLNFSTRVIGSEVKAQAKFRSEARYYDDEGVPVGSGPLPPVVGETTSYQLVWSLRTNVSDFKSVQVSAFLPQNVNWVGVESVSQGKINFNKNNNQIVWSLGNLDVADGEAQAIWKVSITPSVAKVGQPINLLSMSTVTGSQTDGGEVVLTAPLLDTNLAGALYGSGQGLVQDGQ